MARPPFIHSPLAPSLATLGLLLLAGVATADVITVFDFDLRVVGGRNLSFVPVPDLSTTPADPGTFPNSDFDVWGVVDSQVNTDFADESLIDPFESFGMLPSTHVGRFFGVEDLLNIDNPSGQASATWTFDISGYVDVTVSIDAAAVGNFDFASCGLQPCFPDVYTISASIDGGAPVVIFSTSVDESVLAGYTLESGLVVTLNDPISINGTRLTNVPVTLTSGVIGAGSQLTLTLSGQGDSGEEILMFDNITINGTLNAVCPGDFNRDGELNPDDLGDFINCYFTTPPCPDADFNRDGDANPDDLGDYINAYFAGC